MGAVINAHSATGNHYKITVKITWKTWKTGSWLQVLNR
jgi:hypothetical protein